MGSGRECWGGSVTVISIQLCVYCQPSGIRRGSGRECWDGSVTVISIQLCVLLSAECKQEGAREEMLGWE